MVYEGKQSSYVTSPVWCLSRPDHDTTSCFTLRHSGFSLPFCYSVSRDYGACYSAATVTHVRNTFALFGTKTKDKNTLDLSTERVRAYANRFWLRISTRFLQEWLGATEGQDEPQKGWKQKESIENKQYCHDMDNPVSGVWEYKWTTLSLGDINSGIWSYREGPSWRPCRVQKLTLRNPKKWKREAIWQNHPKLAQRRLLCQVMMMTHMYEQKNSNGQSSILIGSLRQRKQVYVGR